MTPTQVTTCTSSHSGIRELTCVVRWADTHVVVDPVHTGSIVLAVVVFTVIRVDLTPLPLKAQRAGAALGLCSPRRRGARGQGVGWQRRRMG